MNAPPSVLRRALLGVAALALAGCSLTRPAPVKQQFLLDPPGPPPVAKAQPTTVRMGVVNVASPFRGRGFVSRAAELRYETDYYNEFVVSPATMLTELTARALERAKVFARVVPPGAAASADWVLDGFASALFEDARTGGGFTAEVAIAYYLSQDGGSGMPLWTREYSRSVPLSGATPQAYAAALNAAYAEIFADLARDLAAADLAAPKR